MHSNTLIEPEPVVKMRLRLFTLYVDFTAGVRAKRAMSRLSSLARQEWNVSAEMWKLDSVSPHGFIREMIAQEASEADVLLVAVSDANQPDPTVSCWLHSLVNWKLDRPAPGLLLGLLGDEEHKIAESNWLVGQLTDFARQTRMDLVWHPVGLDRAEDADWPDTALSRLMDRKRLGDRELALANVTTT